MSVNSEILQSDYLVIGSGLAGLNAALHASESGSVILVTKSLLSSSSSYRAQGGVAAVVGSHDSYESHINDTLNAGRGYCNREAVDVLVKEGASCISRLLDMGMPFDYDGENLNLGLEAGHSVRRILHANGAATGKAMIDFLISKVKKRETVTIIENAFVYDLISKENRCLGALVSLYQKNKSLQLLSKATILASGGFSGLYTRSTNPYTSTGDGLWLAYNHGAVLKDLEFVQFHPTAYYGNQGQVFLLSEALRGEGAWLLNSKGERFLRHHPGKELSPRDVVSGEIVKQIEKQDKPYVYLTFIHLDTKKIKQKFPGLMERVESFEIDISKQGIPVAPAAHYCIGGIETDINGQTAIEGLYACGEVAATGVHGANRLASNSLLECLVFSKRATDHAKENIREMPPTPLMFKSLTVSDELKLPFLVQKKAVTKLLNRYAGIYRSEKGLNLAIHRINSDLKSVLYQQGNEYFFIRMKEMLNLTEMIIRSALLRKESLGVHNRLDYPERDAHQKPVCFVKNNIERNISYLDKAVS